MWLFFLFLGLSTLFFLGTWQAIRGYGPSFTLRNACISNLGNPMLNPKGFRWMNNSLIFLGIAWAFLYVFAFQIFNPISPVVSMIVLIMGLTSCVCSIFVALLHEDKVEIIHFIMGALFFVGFGFGMILFLFYVLFRIIIGEIWPPLGLSIGIIISAITIGILLIILLVKRKGGRKQMNDLEWYLFFMIIIFQGFFFFLLSV